MPKGITPRYGPEDFKRMKDFIGPDNLGTHLKGEGKLEGSRVVAKQVLDSIVVKLRRLVYLILSPDHTWLNNKEIGERLVRDMKDFSENDMPKILDGQLDSATAKLIQEYINEINTVCTTLKKKTAYEGITPEAQKKSIIKEIEIQAGEIQSKLQKKIDEEIAKRKSEEKAPPESISHQPQPSPQLEEIHADTREGYPDINIQRIYTKAEVDRFLSGEIAQLLKESKEVLPPPRESGLENPIVQRLKNYDASQKYPAIIRRDVAEIKEYLYGLYQEKATGDIAIPDSFVQRFNNLNKFITLLEAIEKKEEVEVQQKEIPGKEQRQFIHDTLKNFITTAYENKLPREESTSTPSFLQNQLTDELNEFLVQIIDADFTEAHDVFVVDQVIKACSIIETAFNGHQVPKELSEAFQEIVRILQQKTVRQKAPQGKTLEEIADITDYTTLIVDLRKEALLLLMNSPSIANQLPKDFLTNPDTFIQDIEKLKQAFYKEYQNQMSLPDIVYDHFLALDMMVVRLFQLALAESEKEGKVVPQDPKQQELRGLIKKELSALIDFANSNYATSPQEKKNTILKELLALKNLEFGNVHNLYIIDLMEAIRVLFALTFDGKVPEEIESRLAKVEKRLKELDNSQIGPLLPNTKSIEEIQQINDLKTLREVFTESLTNIVNSSENVKKLFPELESLERFSSLQPAEMRNRISRFHKEVVKSLRENGKETASFFYDQLAVLYEIAKKFQELSSQKVGG